MSRLIATVAGVGYLRPAPGSWASALAVALAWPLHALGGFPALALATCAAVGLGLWAVPRLLAETGASDPPEVVIDEVAGQWLALWPLSAGLWHAGMDPWLFPYPGWLGAFLLFRLFDIWKPGPVGWAERRPGAKGVMLDDLVAGLVAGLLLGLSGYVAHEVLLR